MKSRAVMVLAAIFVLFSGRPATIEAARPWWLPAGMSSANVIGAWQAIGAANLTTSYTDLTGHGHTLTPGNMEPTITANGWKFEMAYEYMQWLDTGVVPAPNNWSMFGVVRNGFSTTVGGVFATTEAWAISLENGTDYQEHARNYNNSTSIYGASTVIGLVGGTAYWNGFIDGGMDTLTETVVNPLFIGAANAGGDGILTCECEIGAFVVFDTALTRQQVFELTKAMIMLPEPMPGPGPRTEYQVDLPNGGIGVVDMTATAGQLFVSFLLLGLIAVNVFSLLKEFSYRSSSGIN